MSDMTHTPGPDLLLGMTADQRLRECIDSMDAHVVIRLYHRSSGKPILLASDIAGIVTERDTLKEINAELLAALRMARDDLHEVSRLHNIDKLDLPEPLHSEIAATLEAIRSSFNKAEGKS